jgi:hypothetical protein
MLNGSVSGQAADVLRQRGDQVVEPAAIEPALAEDAAGFLKALQRAQVDVLSADDSIHSAIYAAGFRFQRSIVYLQSGQGDDEQAQALARLFERYKRLTPGRLYTVTSSRVKVRQLPG